MAWPKDEAKLNRVRDLMKDQDVSALVVRAPDNVLYLTNYWCMIFSLHPQVVDRDGKVCLYTQDTYRVGKTEGECLAQVPWKFFAGQETPETASR